ncbi:hypothetical protein M1146_03265, partial [Patescibacteria group bacterium]|nr:hypothetical protein [Patescibacteria group bacterium]
MLEKNDSDLKGYVGDDLEAGIFSSPEKNDSDLKGYVGNGPEASIFSLQINNDCGLGVYGYLPTEKNLSLLNPLKIVDFVPDEGDSKYLDLPTDHKFHVKHCELNPPLESSTSICNTSNTRILSPGYLNDLTEQTPLCPFERITVHEFETWRAVTMTTLNCIWEKVNNLILNTFSEYGISRPLACYLISTRLPPKSPEFECNSHEIVSRQKYFVFLQIPPCGVLAFDRQPQVQWQKIGKKEKDHTPSKNIPSSRAILSSPSLSPQSLPSQSASLSFQSSPSPSVSSSNRSSFQSASSTLQDSPSFNTSTSFQGSPSSSDSSTFQNPPSSSESSSSNGSSSFNTSSSFQNPPSSSDSSTFQNPCQSESSSSFQNPPSSSDSSTFQNPCQSESSSSFQNPPSSSESSTFQNPPYQSSSSNDSLSFNTSSSSQNPPSSSVSSTFQNPPNMSSNVLGNDDGWQNYEPLSLEEFPSDEFICNGIRGKFASFCVSFDRDELDDNHLKCINFRINHRNESSRLVHKWTLDRISIRPSKQGKTGNAETPSPTNLASHDTASTSSLRPRKGKTNEKTLSPIGLTSHDTASSSTSRRGKGKTPSTSSPIGLTSHDTASTSPSRRRKGKINEKTPSKSPPIGLTSHDTASSSTSRRGKGKTPSTSPPIDLTSHDTASSSNSRRGKRKINEKTPPPMDLTSHDTASTSTSRRETWTSAKKLEMNSPDLLPAEPISSPLTPDSTPSTPT